MAASRTRDWEFDPGIEALAAPYTMAAHAYMSETLGHRYDVALRRPQHGRSTRLGLESRRSEGQRLRVHEFPTCRARCDAIRTCACSSRAAATTSARRTRRPTGRSHSSTAPPEVLARVQHHYFDAGHMMYTRETDLRKLKVDLAAWLES
jgi:hypothetical protein